MTRLSRLAVLSLLCFVHFCAATALAQTRDAAGSPTIRAVRLTAPLRIDGSLDEEVYAKVPALPDFIQAEPLSGPPATQRTEMWVLFDDSGVYVSARCWEEHPERIVADEMRRDSMNIPQNDYIGFSFDTFHDRRNSIVFNITPIGARLDGQVTDERQFNADFNPVYRVEVGRFDGGWTVEAAIPFKSLRYRPGNPQVWGFNAIREVKWQNEKSFLTPMPLGIAYRGMLQTSLFATLLGIEVPSRSRNLDIKPYATSNVTTDLTAASREVNRVNADIGVDVKYGLSQNLTTDFTYNTDFAQVEADEQQINLTRFSLFFPEKREFFLENQGTFSFGGSGSTGASSDSDTPRLFYSRRIGLAHGRAIPIDAGGRVTGRVGRYTVGFLDIRSSREPAVAVPATNFAVVRLKRDLLRRSSVGVMVTDRSAGELTPGRSRAYGVDATFSFFNDLNINTYWAGTRSAAETSQDVSYRAQLDYAGDRYGVQVEHLLVGDDFNPEVGFIRRDDMRRSFGQLRFSPRPASSASVRKFSFTGSMAYVENTAGRLETRDLDGQFAIEFHNADKFTAAYSRTYEFLPRPFAISTGVTLPVGGYDFETARVAFLLAQQRRISGTVSVETGTFYSGTRTVLGLSQGRVDFTSRLSIEPTVSLNWVDLPEGSFTAALSGSRVTYTMTPLMFVSALVQYNSSSHAVGSNVRLRWEYAPGSELFLVFNEQRDTLPIGFPELTNRAFIVKVNRLIRF